MKRELRVRICWRELSSTGPCAVSFRGIQILACRCSAGWPRVFVAGRSTDTTWLLVKCRYGYNTCITLFSVYTSTTGFIDSSHTSVVKIHAVRDLHSFAIDR